jgi:hypothetical protein
MTNWAAGWNMGGYSPDPEHVMVTDDYSSACEYLLGELELWQDHDGHSWDDSTDRCSWDERVNEYVSAVSDLEMMRASGAEVHVLVPDGNGYDYHMWVVPTNEPVDGE